MNELGTELKALAEQARPAELLDRVYGTSRRLRRRRRVTIAAGTLAVAVIAGGVLAPRGGDAPPPVQPSATPSPKSFVPPHEVEDGRMTIPLTLPDGTRTTLVVPEELDFTKGPAQGSYQTADPDQAFCCTFISSVPEKAIKIGRVKDADGRSLEVWSAGEDEDEPPRAGAEEGTAVARFESTGPAYWVKYGLWYVEVQPPQDGVLRAFDEGDTDLADDFPVARKLRFAVDASGFLQLSSPELEFIAQDSTRADFLEGPSLVFHIPKTDRWVEVAKTASCAPERPSLGDEMPNRQLCADGTLVRIIAEKGDQAWVDDLAARLVISP